MTEIKLSEGDQLVLKRMDRLEDKTNERFAGLNAKVTTGFEGIHTKLDSYFKDNDEQVAQLRVSGARLAVAVSLVTALVTASVTSVVTNRLRADRVEQQAIVPKQTGD